MAFRKIDIDALEEDAFGEDEIEFQEIGELRPLSDVEAEVNSRAQEVRSLLQRYAFYSFLRICYVPFVFFFSFVDGV
jgi:hypothetical protein